MVFGIDPKQMVKKEILKIDANKNKIPDALELLDEVEKRAAEAEKAAEQIEPYLNMVDEEDVLFVINLLNGKKKLSEEQCKDFAAKTIEYVNAMKNLDSVAHQVGVAAQAAEDFLKS